MGNFFSIDKHVSNLQDILQLNPKLLSQTKFESSIPSTITHHLKIWKFFEEDSKAKSIKSTPISLIGLTTSQIVFSEFESYLILLIYKNSQRHKFSGFTQPIAKSLESCYTNLTPRGLRTSLCQNIQINDSNILSYSLYIFNGKKTQTNVKSAAFCKGFEFEKLIKNCEQALPILFGGGVIRNKKLQKGSVLNIITQSQNQNKNDVSSLSNSQMQILNITFQKKFSSIENLLNINPHPLKQITYQQKKLTLLQNPTTKLKTPLLNLSLKPFQQTKYQQIQQEFSQGIINFDIRATARHQLKMEHFQGQCNQIIPGLYVSGQKVARDHQILKKLDITYIINCAADYCQNWFQKQGINYLAFFLKDSQNQSIQCLFYRVIQYIQNALNNKKKVLIHCIQGISRSITMVIAYLMFILEYDYKKAQFFVKQKRGVASPNNGFMVQLIQFHKRLYQQFESIPSPRVFLISSHCKETPDIITARLLKHSIYEKRKNIGLDCRTMYIIQTKQKIYLWIGSKCQGLRLQKYWNYAQQYIKKLQKFQNGAKAVDILNQGSEGLEFYNNLWGLQKIPQLYQSNQYTNLFCNLQEQKIQKIKPGANRKLFSNQIEQQQQQKVKHKLFIYPDTKALGIFEMQDLSGLSILFKQTKQSLQVFIWRPKQEIINQQQQKEFLDFLIEKYYQKTDDQNIYIIQETQDRQSQEFLSCFK